MRKIVLSVLVSCALMSARAALFQYYVNLDGPSEFPVNASPGIGSGTVDYDSVAHTLAMSVTFSGLLGTTTASHLHGPTPTPFAGTAGVATTTPSLALFPLGVTSGSFANTLDLTLASSYNPSYVTANGGTPATAEAALVAAIAAGTVYWNIHSSVFGGGEIRGFLTVVPEPSTLALGGLGAAGLAARAWNKRRARKA
jgi:hypothetical protein